MRNSDPRPSLSEDEINNLLSKAGETLQLSEEQKSKLKTVLEETLPTCNQCATRYYPKGHRETLQYETHWGYESTGKDGDTDRWNLCGPCNSKFMAKYDPTCCACHRSVVKVMAELNARNPGSSAYGNMKLAQQQSRKEYHCGLEYAEIEGRIFCEICYEAIINQFKEPVGALSYLFGGGDIVNLNPENPHHRNRLERCFNNRDRDGNFPEARVSFEDACAIREMEDSHLRILIASYQADPPEIAAYLAKRRNRPVEDPEICLMKGNGEYARISITRFVVVGEKGPEGPEGPTFLCEAAPDFSKMEIRDLGQTVAFGDCTISSRLLCEWINLPLAID